MGEFYEVLHRFQWLVLSAMPVVLILATFGGYWMSHRALAPVDEITKTARSISAHNLSQRLVVLGQILTEAERTSYLIENLLTLARADSGAEALRTSTIDLTETIREACAQGQTLAEARQVAFEFRIPDKDVPVQGTHRHCAGFS